MKTVRFAAYPIRNRNEMSDGQFSYVLAIMSPEMVERVEVENMADLVAKYTSYCTRVQATDKPLCASVMWVDGRKVPGFDKETKANGKLRNFYLNKDSAPIGF